MNRPLALLLASALCAPAGCLLDLYEEGPEPEPEDPCPPRQPEAVDPAGARYQYVVDSLDLPATQNEAIALGLDLEDDGQDIDNALGQVVSIIDWLSDDYDLEDEANQLIAEGAALHLIEVQAISVADADGVGVAIAHAIDADGDPSDNFSGDERFDLDAARPVGRVSGHIEGGALHAELGTAELAIAFPGLDEPFRLPLVGVRIEAELDGDVLRGRIGGGIPGDRIDRDVVPVLHEGLTRIIARDCPDGVCESGSFGGFLLGYFDVDGDGVMTQDEFRNNDTVSPLIAPDVDLYDDEGDFSPRCDNVKDALSVALGFTAVPARFASP